MRKPLRLVIWDIDGTLAFPSLERQFVAFLMAERLLSPARLLGRTLRLGLRLPPPPWHSVKLAYVRGESQGRVQDWVESWWSARGLACLLPGAVRAVLDVRDRGVRQMLLSGTADFLARRVAGHLGIADVVAGRSQLVDGRYTGALTAPHPHGRYKVDYASEWLNRFNFSWEEVLALGDHEGDALLLAQAGRALAVNPQPGLIREAKRQSWPVASDAELPGALQRLL